MPLVEITNDVYINLFNVIIIAVEHTADAYGNANYRLRFHTTDGNVLYSKFFKTKHDVIELLDYCKVLLKMKY